MIRKIEMNKIKLLPETCRLTFWSLIIVTTLLSGCGSGTDLQIGQILEDTLPKIYDVYVPAEPYRTSIGFANFTLAATFEANIWADKDTAKSLLIFRPLVEEWDKCGQAEKERYIFLGDKTCARVIDVRDYNCERMPNSDAEHCSVNVTSGTGVYYFQWFFECFNCDGGDSIAAPNSPQDTFKFEVYGATSTNPSPPSSQVDDSLLLDLRDPEDGSICVGNYIGDQNNNGATTVAFRWHEAGSITGTSLVGDFQILIEPVGSNGCSQAQNDNWVNIDDPNADIERPDQCIITFTNINETARNLLPTTNYQWQVRRILNENLAEFGPSTQPFVFTTAGYVTEAPTFIDPNGNDLTNYPTQNEPPMTLDPATATPADIEVRWTPVGCNPHNYAIDLFRDGELSPSFATADACSVDGICEATIFVYAGSSYRLELNQQTDFGNIDTVLNFSIADLP